MNGDAQKPNETPQPAVEKTVGKLDNMAQGVASITPLQELKRRIIRAAKTNVTEFYDRWPERALDERGKDNQDNVVNLIEHILGIVDDYKVEKKV